MATLDDEFPNKVKVSENHTTVTGMIRMVINTVLGLFYINQGSCLWQCRSLDGSYEVLFLVCCLLHSFLRREAAFLFPNMNAEVRLSAPVFFEITDGPAKRSTHSPNKPTKDDPKKMKLPREPTPLLL